MTEVASVMPAKGADYLFYVLRFEDTEDTKVVRSETPLIYDSVFYHEEALRIMGENDPFNTEIIAGFLFRNSENELVVTAQSLRRYVRLSTPVIASPDY